jgi:hypothetical protein
MPSYFQVAETHRPRSRRDSTVTRVYGADWVADPADTTTKPTEELARQAVIAYLGATREENSPSGPFLSQRLYGLPFTSADPEEVAETRGKHWEVTVTWGDAGQSGAFSSSASGASARASGDDPTASMTVSHGFSGQAAGGFLDTANLRLLLSRPQEGGGLRARPFYLGAVNAERVDNSISVNGLNYNPPPADVTARLDLTSANVSADFVRSVVSAASTGLLNTDAFTVRGIAYAPLELLMVGADIQFGAETTVNIEGVATTRRTTSFFFQFASRPVTWLEVTGMGTTGALCANPYVPSGEPWVPQVPLLGAGAVTRAGFGSSRFLPVSGHDYVWRFKSSTLEGEVITDTLDFVSVHKIWPEGAFQTLFGATGL